MKYFLTILALLTVGCVPSQNDSVGENVPAIEVSGSADGEGMCDGATITNPTVSDIETEQPQSD